MRVRSLFTITAAALAMAGCNRGGDAGNNVAALDSQLVGNDADAALSGALGNQIRVDPAVANGAASANGNHSATAQGANGSAGAVDKARLALMGADNRGCAGDPSKFDTNNSWADRLPAAFAPYPGAKLAEAGANNANGCRVRVVSLTTGDDWQKVLDWYNTRAVRAGYSSEHRIEGADHVLGGTNPKDGGAYYLIVTPGSGTTDVSLIANNGR